MSNIDLKEYTRRAKELETALYTQKRLMEEHNAVIEIQKPKKPINKKDNLRIPTKPNYSNYVVEKQDQSENSMWAWGGLIGGFLLLFINPVLGVIGIIIGGVMLASIMGLNGISNSQQNAANQSYNNAMDAYNSEMKRYEKISAEATEEYEKEMDKYSVVIDEYKAKTSVVTEKHDSALASLETALEKLYNENVIFPKYRNMVAITTINEYLESGRCYTLEGPDGAYNLYEMELRQNIVIGQLSNIVSNLEQIRNNQFSLYEELKKSNEKVDDIIYELKVLQADTKLNAYFNYVTAVAETSPKITHGIVY